jgi:tape measure domain-containing protein
MPAIKELTVRFKADLTGLDSGIQKMNATIDQTIKTTQSKYGALSGMLRGAGLAMSAAITAPLVFAAKTAIDTGMQYDSLRRGLEAVTGSGKEAARQWKQLREVAKLPGLGVQEAIEGAIGLEAAGMKIDLVRQYLMGFGNALATVGKGKNELNAVTQQVTQMLGTGKVLNEDIRIIQMYVPQLRQAMKAAFKTADTQEIQKMGIGAEEFIRRISAELNKLPKVTGGVKNAFENLDDAIKDAQVAIFTALQPAVESVTKKLQKAVDWFNNLDASTRKWIVVAAGAAAAVGPLILALSALPNIVAGAQIALAALGKTARGMGLDMIFAEKVSVKSMFGIRLALRNLKAAMVSHPIGWILLALALVIPLVIRFRNQLGLTDQNLKRAGDAIKNTFKPAWDVLKKSVVEFWNSLKQLWTALQPFVQVAKTAGLIYLKLKFQELLLVLKLLSIALKVAAHWVTFLADKFAWLNTKIAQATDALAKFLKLKTGAGTANRDTFLNSLIDFTDKGIRQGAKIAEEFRKKQRDATAAAMENTRKRIDAIKQEIAAEVEKRKAQVGFTSLQGMWQKAMEMGAKERYSVSTTYKNPSAELNVLQRQLSVQEKQVERLDKIIKGLEMVGTYGR